MDWVKSLLKPPLDDVLQIAFILWIFLTALSRSVEQNFEWVQRESEDFPLFPHLVDILELNIQIYQPIWDSELDRAGAAFWSFRQEEIWEHPTYNYPLCERTDSHLSEIDGQEQALTCCCEFQQLKICLHPLGDYFRRENHCAAHNLLLKLCSTSQDSPSSHLGAE